MGIAGPLAVGRGGPRRDPNGVGWQTHAHTRSDPARDAGAVHAVVHWQTSAHAGAPRSQTVKSHSAGEARSRRGRPRGSAVGAGAAICTIAGKPAPRASQVGPCRALHTVTAGGTPGPRQEGPRAALQTGSHAGVGPVGTCKAERTRKSHIRGAAECPCSTGAVLYGSGSVGRNTVEWAGGGSGDAAGGAGATHARTLRLAPNARY